MVDKKERQLVLGIVIACLLISSIALSIVLTSNREKPIQIEKDNVGIASKFGCLKTTDSPTTFQAKQEFTANVLGYQFVRCS